MHDQLLGRVYHMVKEMGHPVARCTFEDRVICFVHMLAVLCDRSEHWASQKRNWPLWARHLKAPSYSQHMRRLRSASVQGLLDRLREAVGAELRAAQPAGVTKICDGKPLLVSGFSRDRDTASGRVPDGWGRGYKLHVVVDTTGLIEAWRVTSLEAGEATIARQLLTELDLRGCLVLGDANFDSNPTYALLADAGGRLLAPRRKPGRGLGRRKHHPDRLHAIEELENAPDANSRLTQHRRCRLRVEQVLGHLCNLPGGLSPLPSHVRRLHRVRRWIAGKILLYHLHLLMLRRSRAAA